MTAESSWKDIGLHSESWE